jgi:hypothetical protein
MIDQIIIINTSGLALFSWGSTTESNSDLISGFLTAINMFAQGERGENVKKITLDPTIFLFERQKDLLFVVLTKDPEAEKIITLLIPEIKKQFFDQFAYAIENFAGNIADFYTFKASLEAILNKFGFLDYNDIQEKFANCENFRCFLFLNKLNGSVLYQKAREYFDRKALEYLALILVKANERIIEESFSEQISESILLTESGRMILIKSTPFIILYQERTIAFHIDIKSIQREDKKILNTIKKPGALLYENTTPFIFFDNKGKQIITNDHNNQFQSNQINVDIITLLTNAINIPNQLYKDKCICLFVITDKSIYNFFTFGKFYCLLKAHDEDFSQYKSSFSNISTCHLDDMGEQEGIDNLLGVLLKFTNLFS